MREFLCTFHLLSDPMSEPSEHPIMGHPAEHHAELLRFLTWKLGCRDLAADFVQEAFLRMARFGSSAQKVEHPRQFLFNVASNLVIDYVRKKRLQTKIFSSDPPPLELASAEPSADKAIYAKQRLAQVQSAVDELPPKCRQALLLNRLEGLTHAEIGRQLGVSESMVAKYIGRALRHCRDRLQGSERRKGHPSDISQCSQ